MTNNKFAYSTNTNILSQDLQTPVKASDINKSYKTRELCMTAIQAVRGYEPVALLQTGGEGQNWLLAEKFMY